MNTEKAIDLLDNLIGMVDDNQENDYDTAFHMAIDALKAQAERTEERTETHACDCISRQAAIELVKDVCDAIMSGCESRYDPETEDEVYKDIREVDAILKCNKEVRIALRNMPSAQQRWIPCNERLPENNRQVLVYAMSVHFALAKYDEMREANGTYKMQWVTFDAWKPFYTIKDVIAWMPLPETYAERRTDDG